MGSRKLLKEGILLKAKSGRKLRAFLCNDIIVLTEATTNSLYRMVLPPMSLSSLHLLLHVSFQPISLAEVEVREPAGKGESSPGSTAITDSLRPRRRSDLPTRCGVSARRRHGCTACYVVA